MQLLLALFVCLSLWAAPASGEVKFSNVVLSNVIASGAATSPNLSSFDEFTGTSAPAGWTFVGSGNGVGCMNGTVVGGTGGSCPSATTGESGIGIVTASSTDAAIWYWNQKISRTQSGIYWFPFRTNQTASGPFFYLWEGIPAPNTATNIQGTSGKVLLRISAATSSTLIGVDRYDNTASRTRTSWNVSTNAWVTPPGTTASFLTDTYALVGIEIDGTNDRWRVHIIGNTGTANTPTTALYHRTLTDWVNFSFHEGTAASYCNPTCGDLYFAMGEPFTDVNTSDMFVDYFAADLGSRMYAWVNGKDSQGGTYQIYLRWAFPDVNGIPARSVPQDRTTVALAPSAPTAWDDGAVKDGYVIRDGSTYHMCYSGASGGVFQVGCASTTNPEGTWTKNANNPIVARVVSTDEDNVQNPTLVKDNSESDSAKRWKMFYIGHDGTSHQGLIRWCSAPPTDAACDTAAEWSSFVKILPNGGASSIDERGWGRVRVYDEGGTQYVFGGVRDNSANLVRQETYATSTDRWITSTNMTKSGVVINPALQSSCSTTLSSAITTPGTRTITVGSTTGCVAGDYVFMDDDATIGNYHNNRILAVLDATHLLLQFTEDAMASGAVVRSSHAFGDLDVGETYAYPGGFYKLATCFDPEPDTSNSAFLENVCLWTGSSRTGTTWTPYPHSSPWATPDAYGRQQSHENVSFVHEPIP